LPTVVDPKIITITAHRRENFGKPLIEICNALLELVEKYNNLIIVFPVHPNPNVRKIVNDILHEKNRILLIEPLDYLSFIFLMKKSYIILTDSGGIQEEAPSLNIPVLVLRTTTERTEGVKAGTIKLIGIEKNNIIKNVSHLLSNRIEYSKMTKSENPYGDGLARMKISSIIKSI
jgi:UDP-N-acetylglucosamine 2-epimerase